MSPDWQAYEDETLTAAERTAADSLLRTDPAARAELAALRRLRQATREAVLAEEVPEKELKARLAQVTRSAPEQLNRMRVVFAFAAAFLLIAVFATSRLRPLEQGAVMELRTESVQLARDFAGRSAQINAPVPALAGLGQFQRVHCGKDWACFDYLVDGRTVHVHVQRDSGGSLPGEMVAIDGFNMYISTSITWRCHGMVYEASGTSLPTLRRVALQAAAEVASQS
ncbi:MAG: hypothetical protein KIT11_02865 [Fimbriimonadaceae bacterium]|nr:hypothetical protein [Fimbriimonadaceae bacterium]QYK54690.1 MAG: hypothetical protein KF733_06660 [Fimbriimonadaceae bacterium]